MNPRSLVAAGLAVLLVAAGGGAALTETVQTAGDGGDATSAPRGVDVAATHDDGTVTVTVTDDGAGVEGVAVHADDERVGTTDANGTVAFETDADDELELELTTDGFEGELEYVLQDGSLTLVEEEYEYAEPDDEESEDANEDEESEDADDEESEDADDEESEDANEDEESEDADDDDADDD